MHGAPRHQLELDGLVSEHLGLAAWNADGSGPEPQIDPRSFETPLGRITHHVYAATPDYGGIDPSSAGGLKATSLTGFEALQEALTNLGAAIGQITISWGLMTEAPGEFTHDANHFETRKVLIHGPIVVRFATRPALLLPAEWATNTIDWNVDVFTDSVHRSVTQPAAPVLAANATGAARAVGEAMLDDVAGRSVTLDVEGIVIHEDATFAGNGRVDGMLIDMPFAKLSVEA